MGTKTIEKRVTVGLTSALVEKLQTLRAEKGLQQSRSVQFAIGAYFDFQEKLAHDAILIQVAPRDRRDLERLVQNGLVVDIDHAINEAIRRYFEWTRTELEARRKTIGNF